ncbi:MAG: TolC family protein [Candidatus Zixiibacteriota bacterium]
MKQFTTILILAIGVVTFTGPGTPVQAEELTLEQCIDIALEQNGSREYGLPSARENYHRARQAVWSAWGDFLPSLSHGYNYRHNRFGDEIYDPTTGQFIPIPKSEQTSTSWSTGFTLSQTLFDGGANFYRIAQSYHARAAQEENVRGAENDLILGVKERYFSLLKAQKLVEVQQAAVARAEEFLKTIESRYELGSASLSEVLKARVQLGTEQLELLRRRNDVEVGRASLNTILNRSVDSEITVADISDVEPEVMSYEEATKRALELSPAVQIARANLRIAKDDIGIARATFFPSFSWNISRNFSPRERNDLLDFDGRFATWGISASLNFSLFNGFHRKTAISNARVGVKYTSEQLEQAEKAVALAVKQAHLGVKLADETRNLAEQTEVSAQEDFNLAQEKYNLGAATILDLLDAQVSLTRAQNDRVNALFDYLVAVARLENAVGEGR